MPRSTSSTAGPDQQGNRAVETAARSQAEHGGGYQRDTANDREPRDVSRSGNRQSSDDVAHRAYELYRERGSEDGHDMDDWFQAERELQNQ